MCASTRAFVCVYKSDLFSTAVDCVAVGSMGGKYVHCRGSKIYVSFSQGMFCNKVAVGLFDMLDSNIKFVLKQQRSGRLISQTKYNCTCNNSGTSWNLISGVTQI